MALIRRAGVIVAVLAAMLATSVMVGTRLSPDTPPATAPGTTVATVGSADGAATSPPSTLPPVSTTSTVVALGVPEEPQPEPAPPAAGRDPDFDGLGVVTVASGGAALARSPGGAPFVLAREGLVFPALGKDGDWIMVMTTCDEDAWVHASEVAAATQAAPARIGAGFDMTEAVVIVDPGHGGPNIGTSSPDGSLLEKDVNADIARRVRDLLESPHTVDWESGVVFVGDGVAAAGRVLLTRVGEGDGADYEAGLIYRANLANAAGAHVMVSIHNNAGWEVPLDHPGSDVYYQSQIDDSRRLGELLVEEFQRSLGVFEAEWVGAIEWGPTHPLAIEMFDAVVELSDPGAIVAAPKARAMTLETERLAVQVDDYRPLPDTLTLDLVVVEHDSDMATELATAATGDAPRFRRVWENARFAIYEPVVSPP